MNDSGPGLIDAVLESWRLVFGNARELVRISLVPFFVFLVLHRMRAVFLPEEGLSAMGGELLFAILAAPPAAMILMPWYRRLLAPVEPGLAAKPAMGWSVVLMGRWVGLEIMFFILLAPITALMLQIGSAAPSEGQGNPPIGILYDATIILGLYLVFGRMGLALPAAASESDHSYRRSWVLTEPCGWRIGLAILICLLSTRIPAFLLGELLATEDAPLVMRYLDAALKALFSILNEFLGAAIFAQFYIARAARPMSGEW